MNEDRPDKQVSLNVFDRITSICAEFRRKYKRAENPAIEQYLDQVPDEARLNLFTNLLQIEIRYREQTGQRPNSKDYIKRFPEFSSIIRQAFDESTQMSVELLISTPNDSIDHGLQTRTLDIPAANRLGEYELIRELGRGGFGVVYEARHLQRQNRVALKTLPTGGDGQELNAERLHRFRKEFRSLSEVNHPNLVGMQTLEVDGAQWFFTMDLIHGGDFLDYVRPHDMLDESRLRKTLGQLVSGMIGLHELGIVHRDLKPSNVLVSDDGRVTILDFGLVAELRRATDQTASLRSEMFAGTPRYAAPEQLFGERSEASDWYALGVMLFEALTGEPPFKGTQMQLLQQKQNADPERLEDRPDLPQDLAGLTDQLLQRDPTQRPDSQSVAETLALDLETKSHGSINDEDFEPETASTIEQVLVGREQQLQQLEQIRLELLNEREPIVVFTTGRSGEGKSALAERFLQPIRRGKEMLVLSGRCYDRESVPFKAVDSVIDALVLFLRSRKKDEVSRFIPDDVQMLVHLFPIVRRVEQIADLPQKKVAGLDAKQIRDRAFGALRQMLVRIGLGYPIVIYIDDLQWGDSDSASVLLRLLSPPDAPPVMLLGSYRSDEVAKSPFLTTWNELRQQDLIGKLFRADITLGPLTQVQCMQLAVLRIGRDEPEIRQHAAELYRISGGNPYFLEQLIEGFDPETNSFRAKPLRGAIDGKLQKLPAEAASMLKVVAVSGNAISVEEASLAAGGVTSMFSTVTHMRTERLLRLIGSGEQQQVDTWHDKIRETVLDQLDDDTRKGIHLRIGETIELRQNMNADLLLQALERGEFPDASSRLFDAAYHFDAAGHTNKALTYSLLAAEQARSQFSQEVAIENYLIAERHLTSGSRALKYRIAVGHGETLLRAGRFSDAEHVLHGAVDLTDQLVEKARVKAFEADIAYRIKTLPEAIEGYKKLLRPLGIRVPETGFGLFEALFRESAIRIGRIFLPDRWYLGNRPTNAKTEFVLRILNVNLNFAFVFRSPLRYLWCAMLATNRAERNPKSSLLAASYGRYSAGLFNFGLSSLADKYHRRAQELISQLDDLSTQADINRSTGFGLLHVGRFDEGLAALQDAADAFENKVPEFFRLKYTKFWAAEAFYRLGDLDSSVEIARELFHDAVNKGMNRLAQQSLELWSRCRPSSLPFDEFKNRFKPAPDDYVSTIQMMAGEARWHLRNGRTGQAVEIADQGYQLLRQTWAINLNTVIVVAILVAALREHAQTIADSDPRESQRLKNRSLKVARWGVRATRFIRIEYPACLRELSLTLVDQGRIRRALKHARKSCAVAEEQNARFEYAQSLLVCGQLGSQLGLPAAEQQLEQANALLAEFAQAIQ